MKIFKKFINNIDIKKCNKNYKKILPQIALRSKNKPLNVLFLVRENSKWSYQSLYELFLKDDNFNPVVAVSVLTLVHDGKDKTRSNLEESYNFFKSKAMNVVYAYKNGEYVDLKEFNPDIIFYDEPWDLPEIHKPKYVSDFALTCYSSYSYLLVPYKEEFFVDFYNSLFCYFSEDDNVYDWYYSCNRRKINNCFKTGYIKFDEYLNNSSIKDYSEWKNPEKYKIIYAPHHSFENKGINIATFRENGKFILELAKKYPQTTWIFKPHPRFEHRILRSGIMTRDELNNYFDEWEKVAKIYQNGDYIRLFAQSDLMITDSSSFLAEYLYTKKPLIRPVNKNQTPFNKTGNEIIKAYYNVFNNEELEKTFSEIVINKNDYKAQQRIELSNKFFNDRDFVAKKIVEILKREIGINK